MRSSTASASAPLLAILPLSTVDTASLTCQTPSCIDPFTHSIVCCLLPVQCNVDVAVISVS